MDVGGYNIYSIIQFKFKYISRNWPVSNFALRPKLPYFYTLSEIAQPHSIYLLEADTETFLNWKLLISLYIDSLIHQDAVQYIVIPQGFYKCRQILKRMLRGDRGHYKLTMRVVCWHPEIALASSGQKKKGNYRNIFPHPSSIEMVYNVALNNQITICQWRESNPQPFGLAPNVLTTTPELTHSQLWHNAKQVISSNPNTTTLVFDCQHPSD